VLEAFGWGLLASSSLLAGAALAFVLRPGPRLNAVVLALGSGVLVGAIAYELVEDALKVQSFAQVALFLLLGSGVYVAGVLSLARRGVRHRKSPHGRQADSAAEAIVLGSVLDGIPESLVLGLTVLNGGVSVPFLAGVALSNLPEGMASSSGLAASGWSRGGVLLLWAAVALASGAAAAAGYAVLQGDSARAGGLAQAFAAGALLTMIADTMLPEAYAVEREWTGPLVVVGFSVAIGLGAL
jgi:ZIP family zinc transporter